MSMNAAELPVWEELPDFGLYMDQLITCARRVYGDAEFAVQLTPGMINSYVKNGLVDRPIGKKYSRAALAQLLMVCYLKPAIALDRLKMMLHAGDETAQQLYSCFRSMYADIHVEVFQSNHSSALRAAISAAAWRSRCLDILEDQTASSN